MGWIKRKVDEHVCPRPVWNKDIAVGDVWQCDECKREWEVMSLKRGQYDQRDGWWGGEIIWKTHYTGSGVTSWRDQ